MFTACRQYLSHGTAGTLKCQDDDGYIVFNDVLLEFTRKVVKDIPMVSTFS